MTSLRRKREINYNMHNNKNNYASQQYMITTKQAMRNKNKHVIKDQALHVTSVMCYAHYEEQD